MKQIFALLTGILACYTCLCGAEYDMQASMHIDAIPLSAILPASFPYKGTARGLATLKGESMHPQIELSLHVDDLTIIGPTARATPPASADITLSFANGELTASGTIITVGDSPITFNLHVPATVTLFPLAFDIDPKAPITGHASASGEISTLMQLVSDSKVLLSGQANTAITVTGTFGTPEIRGVCDITDGRYEIPEIGAVLSGLTAHIEGTGTQLQVLNLHAFDGRGGSVTGTGSMLLDFAKELPFSLELSLNQVVLLNQDYLYAVCSGPLMFHGDGSVGMIEGDLTLNTGEIIIPDQPQTTIYSVDVTFINVPQSTSPPQQFGVRHSDWPLKMDVRLNIPDNLSIHGRDLSSSWKGNLTIQGEIEALNLVGQLKVVNGEYLFNGNPFAIRQGTITFAGDVDKKTTLYVIARKDLDTVQVDVIAKGPVQNPTISFRSNPPLPQREILSWILFNRGSSEISQFQGAQLSESITNLKTGQQGGPDVLSKIRSSLGIDRFEIRRSSKGDNSNVDVQIGKYISEGVLISAIKSDVNRLAIEANITERIKLQAQVGDDTEGQLLLKWKRIY
ncbi:MAG: translocation/assembly module TamB domain-containing protein [Parachlamydiaceae bacterium]